MIRFPNGSFRGLDVAIDCQDNELKDTIGLPFYLAQGIADVVLYDPRQNEVVHTAPVEMTFACGCAVTIPL